MLSFAQRRTGALPRATAPQPCANRSPVVRRQLPHLPAAAEAGNNAAPSITIKIEQKDGDQPIAIQCESGEQLRAVMLDSKVDLYTTWGKIWSCGGAGQCGTCIVQVVEGADLLSERTNTEEKKLNKKPESWRLACQTIVGDGSNSGSITIRTKPQG